VSIFYFLFFKVRKVINMVSDGWKRKIWMRRKLGGNQIEVNVSVW